MGDDASMTLPPDGETMSGDPSLSITRAVAEGEPEALRPWRAGDRLGRYVVLEQIGRGGMSIVYAAYDPELDRRVAIKVLLPHRTAGLRASTARTRLLREAQAIAQVSHPNVIAVHDVGVERDQVFLAMEFVAGQDLKKWQADAPSVPEVLGVYAQAGRGLLAAHRAGLVHRDFKPDNVLLGDDGRVRVVDFGLVFTRAPVSDSPLPAPAELSSSADVTRTGAMIGTPAYMSPEQFAGKRGDERSDQFSFCVALYEGLFGQRPFPGDDLASIARSVVAGELREPPPGRAAPGAVVRALRRGLATDPQARYPSMAELLADLAHDPRARWRKVGVALAGVGVVGLAAAAYFRGPDASDALCHGGAERVAAVWSETRAARMQAAFEATEASLAGDTWARASGIVGAYLGGWNEEYDAACRRTRITKSQSEEMLDLQVACLEGRLREVAVVAEVFENANAGTVVDAVDLANRLSPISQCSDLEALQQRIRPPADPDVRARVEAARDELSQIDAKWALGDQERVFAMMADLGPRAAAIDYPPLAAEIAVAEAGYAPPGTSMADRVDAYEKAFDEALAAGHDIAAIEAATSLLFIHSNGHLSEEAGQAWARHALALHDRAETPPEMRVSLLSAWGILAGRDCELDDAIALYEKGIEITRAAGKKTPLATLYNNLGGTYGECGRYDEAAKYLALASELETETRGPLHPGTLNTKTNLGSIRFMMGDDEAGIRILEEALAASRDSAWQLHGGHGRALVNLARAYRRNGRLDDALRVSAEALEVHRKYSGERSYDHADALEARGLILQEQGDLEGAEELFRRSDEIMRELDSGAARRGLTLFYLATARARLGRLEDAAETTHEALRVINPERRARRSRMLAMLVDIHLDLGQLDRARERYQEAEASRGDDEDDQSFADGSLRLARLRLGDFGPPDSDEARAEARALRAELKRRNLPTIVERLERWQRDPSAPILPDATGR